jgi:hypothetical protein
VLVLLRAVASVGLLQRVVLLFLLHPLRVASARCYPLLHGLLLENPVVHEVKVETFLDEELSEHGDDHLVVRLLFELELPAVVQVLLELLRVASRQVLHTGHCLLDFDLLVLLFLGLGWQPLPRQVASQEVHEHDANLLQVVPPRLLNAQVRVQTGVPGRACERLVVFEGDVAPSLGVLVALGEAEVDDVDDVLVLARAN